MILRFVAITRSAYALLPFVLSAMVPAIYFATLISEHACMLGFVPRAVRRFRRVTLRLYLCRASFLRRNALFSSRHYDVRVCRDIHFRGLPRHVAFFFYAPPPLIFDASDFRYFSFSYFFFFIYAPFSPLHETFSHEAISD